MCIPAKCDVQSVELPFPACRREDIITFTSWGCPEDHLRQLVITEMIVSRAQTLATWIAFPKWGLTVFWRLFQLHFGILT